MPRLLYVLRTAYCGTHQALNDYDNLLRSILSRALNLNLSDTHWVQASLPVQFGGLGVRGAVLLAPSAFLASAAGSFTLTQSLLPNGVGKDLDVYTNLAMNHWLAAVGGGQDPPAQSHRQKMWDNACCKSALLSIMSSAAHLQDRARLLAIQSWGAGAWLSALPASALGLRLSDETVRIAAGLRLGADLCHPHTCRCGATVEARGTHGLACRFSAGRHARHSQVNELVRRALLSANIPSVLEPQGLLRSDNKRPDGLSLVPWSAGRCLVWDATIPDTLAPSHLQSTSQSAGTAAARAAASKMAKYSEICNNYYFVPLAIETLGSFCQEGRRFVADLGRRLTASTGDVRSGSYLRQRLSIAIQRGNAAAVLGTLPATNERLFNFNLNSNFNFNV